MKRKSRDVSTDWKAGIARADITPQESIWLAGWGSRTKPSQGVSHPIWAKAIALRDNAGHLGVLVTTDLLGFSASMTATIVAGAKKKHGLDRSQLILNASHNHSGPVTGDVLFLYFTLPGKQGAVIERYTKWLLNRIVDLIGEAIDNLKPARMAFGQGLAGRRRQPSTRARRRTSPGDRGRSGCAGAERFFPAGRVAGHRVRLRLSPYVHRRRKGKRRLAGLRAIGTGEDASGATALFVQNCGGDINPLPRFRPGLGERYGFIVAAAVEQVLESQARDQQLSGQAQGGKLRGLSGPLRMAFADIEIPFLSLPTREELRSLVSARKGMRLREVEYQLSLLRHGDRRPRSLRFPIHVWQFGTELKFIGLSSETVTDYSLRLKQTYGWDNTWVSGYNDDYWCYVPSLRVWQEGGYEGHTGMMECSLPSPFAPSVEEVIAEGVDELVQKTSAKPRQFPKPSAAE